MAKQDAPVDPEVQKWLEENAISTGKADINLVVTEGHDNTKLKDTTTKFLALARHLLSFYPGTHAKEVAAAKKGKAALQDSDSDASDESSDYSPPSSTDDD